MFGDLHMQLEILPTERGPLELIDFAASQTRHERQQEDFERLSLGLSQFIFGLGNELEESKPCDNACSGRAPTVHAQMASEPLGQLDEGEAFFTEKGACLSQVRVNRDLGGALC